MNQYCPVGTLTHAILMLLAALLVSAPLGTVLAEQNAGGAVETASSVPLPGLYNTGKALGIPAILSIGATNGRLLAAGDYDGDGIADLAVGDGEDQRLVILTGDGLGRFADSGISQDWRPKMVAHADVDGDGLDDEIVGRSPTTMFSVRLAAGGGSGVVALVADFNRDGVADLAVSDGNRLAIYHGDKNGALRASARLAVGGTATALAIGDFNRDDVADIAVATDHNSVIAIFVGDGRGGFAARSDIPAGVNAAGLLAADLDGDGVTDLAATDEQSDDIAVILANQGGGFGAPLLFAVAEPGAAAPYDAPASDPTVYEGVASLSLNPTIISGGSGGTATGTVTLNAPAPAGGVVVALASSNVELAATVPSITIPAGANTGTFAVETNAFYRRFSGLAFRVTISATHAATVSATLILTAQARPADFNSGVAAGDQTQWEGLMCSNIPPIGWEGGILFECSLPPAIQGQWGSCTFRQECSIGCRRVPPNGVTFNDFCATTGPNPVSVSRNYVISGDRVPASLLLEAPAAAGATTSGFVSAGTFDGNARAFPSPTQPVHPNFPFPNIAFPTGATSATFDVGTSYVPSTNFVGVQGEWHPPGNGGPFIINEGRSGQAWLVMVPPDPPPAAPIPTLGGFSIHDANPVTGGQSSIASFSLSGLSPGGGPTITLTSSHPAIVPVPATVVAPATNQFFDFGVSIATNSPAMETLVTVTATDGRYTFSDILTVRPAPPPPVIAGLSVNPISVVGGNSATATVTLSGPQSGPTEITVLDPVSTAATMPASITVPGGATSASFAIATAARTAADGQFNLNIDVRLTNDIALGAQALLLITPPGPLTLKRFFLDADARNLGVAGGKLTTGAVTLTGAAPTGGAVVTLASSNTAAATVPASVTVAAGAISASFTVATSVVPAGADVTISATFNGVTLTDSFRVLPVLAFVLFDPTTAVGGASTTGSVTLRSAAPAGGAVVTLASSNSVVASVPGSVTVPAGQTSATFTVNTGSVTTTFVNVDISASYGGVTVSSSLTVFNSAGKLVSSVTLNPTSVVGPGSVTATVTMNGAVTSCCPSVDFASSDPALAQVPTGLNFSVGQTSATFTVNTGSVTAARTVTISASANGATRSATLTVNPPGGAALSAVSLNPASVAGGTSSTGTVTLNAAAPSGGAVVNLSSNNAVATVPASVTVPAGATSANFTATTSAVTVSTGATISATFGGVLGTATLTVTPGSAPPAPTLSAVSLNPTSVVGGTSSTGTVTLSAAAPTGGAVVTLSDDSTATTVPVSVTVPAGATNANFTVTTTSVTVSTSATISGTGGGVTRSATLTVNPAPPPTPAVPTLVSPADSATPAQPVTFDWNDVANATSYEIQVDNSSTIAAPFTANQTVSASQVTIGGLPAQRLWWRVRAQNSVGVFGPFSATRRFTPQAATAPSLSALAVNPTSVVGPASATGTATLTAAAPTGGAVVTLTSGNTAAATVPASITVPAGATSATFTVTTVAVSASTSVTLTGTFGGANRTTTLTVASAPPPASLSALTLNPTSVVGGNSSTGTVTLSAAAPSGGASVSLASSNPAVANVPASVTIAAGATSAAFAATTSAVTTSTAVTVTATYNGTSKTTTLTVTPVPPPASLQSVSMNPASVTGGTNSQGTVTLSSGAPSGGAAVSLSSSNPAAATVPASVTVAAGATSATFTITTTTVSASTAVTISATYSGVTRTAGLTVTPPGQAVTLTVTATGRSGERVTSSPAGINVAVGSTGSASFAVNTSITLSVSNGRDAIWSGACSSGGDKTRSCTFTMTANASVTGNVQ